MGTADYGQPTDPLNAPSHSAWAADVHTAILNLQTGVPPTPAWPTVTAWEELPAAGDYPGQQTLVGDAVNVGLLVARWTGTAWIVDPLSDTGWRDMGAALKNGWTATTLFARRQGERAYLTFAGLDFSAATADGFLAATSLGTGWTRYPNLSQYRPYAQSSTLITRLSIPGAAGDFASQRPAGMSALNGQIDWFVETAWPTTLPGTAV